MRGGRLGGVVTHEWRAKFREAKRRGLSSGILALDGTSVRTTGDRFRDSTAALDTGAEPRHRLRHKATPPSFLEAQSAILHCPGVQQQGAGFGGIGSGAAEARAAPIEHPKKFAIRNTLRM